MIGELLHEKSGTPFADIIERRNGGRKVERFQKIHRSTGDDTNIAKTWCKPVCQQDGIQPIAALVCKLIFQCQKCNGTIERFCQFRPELP